MTLLEAFDFQKNEWHVINRADLDCAFEIKNAVRRRYS